ncbi:MAG: hypothetical protein AB8B82_02005 [Roseovarius sp.]
MSTPITITETERGVVRVFAIDLTDDALKAFVRRNGSWALQEALGADVLTPDLVEVFDVADLTGLGLSGYLHEGQGIAPGDLDPLRAQLDAITGSVMVLPSSAFAGTAQTLSVRAPLRLVATFNEDKPPVAFEPLPDASAKGEVSPEGKPRPSDAAMSGRVATVALLLIFIFTALMIWIAA